MCVPVKVLDAELGAVDHAPGKQLTALLDQGQVLQFVVLWVWMLVFYVSRQQWEI